MRSSRPSSAATGSPSAQSGKPSRGRSCLSRTAPKAGLADLVPAPFTPPTIGHGSVSCIGRTYAHGRAGLLESLIAAGQELLAAPAALKVKIGDGPAVSLAGGSPKLTAQRKRASRLPADVFRPRAENGRGRHFRLRRVLPLLRPACAAARGRWTSASATWSCRFGSRTPRSWTRPWSGCGRTGEQCTGFLDARPRPPVGLEAIPLRRAASARATCRRSAGSATTTAAFASPAPRTRACTTTTPCRPPRSIAKAGRSSFGPGSSTSR